MRLTSWFDFAHHSVSRGLTDSHSLYQLSYRGMIVSHKS
jgi:hypothetical protein